MEVEEEEKVEIVEEIEPTNLMLLLFTIMVIYKAFHNCSNGL